MEYGIWDEIPSVDVARCPRKQTAQAVGIPAHIRLPFVTELRAVYSGCGPCAVDQGERYTCLSHTLAVVTFEISRPSFRASIARLASEPLLKS